VKQLSHLASQGIHIENNAISGGANKQGRDHKGNFRCFVVDIRMATVPAIF